MITIEVYGSYTLNLGQKPVTFSVGGHDSYFGLVDSSSGTLNVLLRGSNPVRKTEIDEHEAARIVELVLKRHGTKQEQLMPLDEILKKHREIIRKIRDDVSSGTQGTLY